jgi:hypothetical protein
MNIVKNLIKMKFVNDYVSNIAYWCYINIMKKLIISLILCFYGMTIFAQDMSYYTTEFTMPEGTYASRLHLLESVRDSGMTGIGGFYHDALKYLLTRIPDIKTRTEQEATEQSAIILSQGLGAEKYTAAAGELWQIVEIYDVTRGANEGNTMQAALIALGQVNGREFLPYIIQRLNEYNSQTFRNAETRRRYQAAVIGCISALETFQDLSGFSPVFFVSVGSYDPAVRQIANNALPNIAEDPGDVISTIIQNTTNNPVVKLEAWNQMLRSRAPNSSKARVATVAIATSYSYPTTDLSMQKRLGDMRKSAIKTIMQFGVSDNIVYTYLDRSYSTNFNNNAPDYEEIILTLNALAAIKSDEAVDLFLKYLRELNERRYTGPWTDKERQVFQWVVSCIGVTKTTSPYIRILLGTIQRNSAYTPYEQGLARNALTQLAN